MMTTDPLLRAKLKDDLRLMGGVFLSYLLQEIGETPGERERQFLREAAYSYMVLFCNVAAHAAGCTVKELSEGISADFDAFFKREEQSSFVRPDNEGLH